MQILNEALGVSCDLKLHPRAWTSNWYTNRVDGMVKKDKTDMVKIEGWYTNKVQATVLINSETWTIFRAPPYMSNSKKNFDMNAFSLQMNQTSEELLSKISPTDSRRRKDI